MTQAVTEPQAPDALIRFAIADVPLGAALRQMMIEKLGWTWILAIGVAAMAVMLHLAGVAAWILWLGLGTLALMLATTLALWFVTTRRWRQNAELAGGQPSEVGAGATGLHSRNRLGETRVAWSVIKRVQRFPEYWLIHFLTTDDVVVIPTAAITPQFRAAFDIHAGAAGVRVSGN